MQSVVEVGDGLGVELVENTNVVYQGGQRPTHHRQFKESGEEKERRFKIKQEKLCPKLKLTSLGHKWN